MLIRNGFPPSSQTAVQSFDPGSLRAFEIDPLGDPRWEEFVQAHPDASVFHTPSWLRALRDTYGYEPSALCTAEPAGSLTSGLVFCKVNTWLTGDRIVSLPFSDHCEPLLDSGAEADAILSALQLLVGRTRWKSVELRPLKAQLDGYSEFRPCHTYLRHTLDLSRSLDVLFLGFHKSCVQRKIRRAEREGLEYEVGNSEALVSKFYDLLVVTRRRHGLPPQPYSWFRQLSNSFGNALQIRVATYAGQPVASILTLKYRHTVFYKYGCSKARFNSLGGIPLLLWRSIQEAKAEGLTLFDLGRSDPDNLGLIGFKDRWGANSATVNYLKFPGPVRPQTASKFKSIGAGVFARIAPRWCLIAIGKLLYRHIA